MYPSSRWCCAQSKSFTTAGNHSPSYQRKPGRAEWRSEISSSPDGFSWVWLWSGVVGICRLVPKGAFGEDLVGGTVLRSLLCPTSQLWGTAGSLQGWGSLPFPILSEDSFSSLFTSQLKPLGKKNNVRRLNTCCKYNYFIIHGCCPSPASYAHFPQCSSALILLNLSSGITAVRPLFRH